MFIRKLYREYLEKNNLAQIKEQKEPIKKVLTKYHSSECNIEQFFKFMEECKERQVMYYPDHFVNQMRYQQPHNLVEPGSVDGVISLKDIIETHKERILLLKEGQNICSSVHEWNHYLYMRGDGRHMRNIKFMKEFNLEIEELGVHKDRYQIKGDLFKKAMWINASTMLIFNQNYLLPQELEPNNFEMAIKWNENIIKYLEKWINRQEITFQRIVYYEKVNIYIKIFEDCEERMYGNNSDDRITKEKDEEPK